MDSFFTWLFDLPGWVQLGIATVWVYLLMHLGYWHIKYLDEVYVHVKGEGANENQELANPKNAKGPERGSGSTCAGCGKNAP